AGARPRVARADRLIIGVEQEIKMIVKIPVSRQMRYKNETLEEPRRMSEMPLCRAGVRHRLHRGIGLRQRRDQRFTRVPEATVQLAQCRELARRTRGMCRIYRCLPNLL